MNHTQNYNLNQWVKSDQVRMEDFNADNAKIDAAIKTVEQKADSLTAGKADASAVTALSQTVAAHTSALSKKGNCQIYTASYVGTGTYGSDGRCSLQFSAEPQLVIVLNVNGHPLVMLRPLGFAIMNGRTVDVLWSSRGVSWYSTEGSTIQLNQQGSVYPVAALLALN